MEEEKSCVIMGDRQSLPKVYISNEEETEQSNLRQRLSSCNSPVGSTVGSPHSSSINSSLATTSSTPFETSRNKIPHFGTPGCTEYYGSSFQPSASSYTEAYVPPLSVKRTLDYGCLTPTTDKKSDESIRIDSGYGYSSSSPSSSPRKIRMDNDNNSLWDSISVPVESLGRKFRGRPSYLDDSSSSKMKFRPQHILVLLILALVVVCIGFTFLVCYTQFLSKSDATDHHNLGLLKNANISSKDESKVVNNLNQNKSSGMEKEIDAKFVDVNRSNELKNASEGNIVNPDDKVLAKQIVTEHQKMVDDGVVETNYSNVEHEIKNSSLVTDSLDDASKGSPMNVDNEADSSQIMLKTSEIEYVDQKEHIENKVLMDKLMEEEVLKKLAKSVIELMEKSGSKLKDDESVVSNPELHLNPSPVKLSKSRSKNRNPLMKNVISPPKMSKVVKVLEGSGSSSSSNNESSEYQSDIERTRRGNENNLVDKFRLHKDSSEGGFRKKDTDDDIPREKRSSRNANGNEDKFRLTTSN